jgi:16S rRNA G966 N2-methylase RsmD
MRIISGTNKGKKLYAPEGKRVRPTGDKIKEAIFNIIGSIDEESTVLELFAGSGSIGIEFLARGAKHCTFVDISRKSLNYVKKNLELCNFSEKANIISSDYEKAIINAIRDFIYNITDYGLIITVIVVMTVILIWRFDLLFSRGIEKKIIKDLPIINEPEVNEPIAEVPEPEEEEPEPEDETPTGLIAAINIPQGSFPSQIAEILLNNNLIKSKDEFLTRCVELDLDTRLQSGTFNIEVGTPLDDVIKIIANAY